MKLVLFWLLVFTLTCAPWLMRTAYYAPGHNPVYPKSILWWQGEFGQDFPFQHVSDDIQTAMKEKPILTLWQSTMDPTGMVDGDQKLGGWGPLFNVLCIPAIIIGIVLATRRREWSLVLLLACILLPWAVFPQAGALWARFVLPWTLAGFVALGVVLKEVK